MIFQISLKNLKKLKPIHIQPKWNLVYNSIICNSPFTDYFYRREIDCQRNRSFSGYYLKGLWLLTLFHLDLRFSMPAVSQNAASHRISVFLNNIPQTSPSPGTGLLAFSVNCHKELMSKPKPPVAQAVTGHQLTKLYSSFPYKNKTNKKPQNKQTKTWSSKQSITLMKRMHPCV